MGMMNQEKYVKRVAKDADTPLRANVVIFRKEKK